LARPAEFEPATCGFEVKISELHTTSNPRRVAGSSQENIFQKMGDFADF